MGLTVVRRVLQEHDDVGVGDGGRDRRGARRGVGRNTGRGRGDRGRGRGRGKSVPHDKRTQ